MIEIHWMLVLVGSYGLFNLGLVAGIGYCESRVIPDLLRRQGR